MTDMMKTLVQGIAEAGVLPQELLAHAHAIVLGTGTAENFVTLAFSLLETGHAGHALSLLEEAARLRPDSPSPALYLGIVLRDLGQIPAAIDVLEAAAARFPNEIALHSALAEAHRLTGNFDKAVASALQAVAQDDAGAREYYNLALIFQEQGRLSTALVHYAKALELNPDLQPARINLANCLRDSDQTEEALLTLEKALGTAPVATETAINLGDLYRVTGHLDKALAHTRQALTQSPGHPGARFNLAVIHHDRGDVAAALAEYDDLAEQAPNLAAVHLGRAVALRDLNRLTEAEQACRRAVQLAPDMPSAVNSLGSILLAAGHIEDAAETFARAVIMAPDDATAHSNLIFALDLLPDSSPEKQQAERRRWHEIRKPRGPLQDFPDISRQPDKRLRVGYVSADFRIHSASAAFSAVLGNHTAENFETVCYSATGFQDSMTARCRSASTLWRDIHGLGDARIAEMIRSDGIDILVDLSGHSAGNKLGVFAMKPAPVQVTAWGLANGTGLATIDALLADPRVIPADVRPLYAETIVDLPGLICFSPPEDAPEVVLDRPQQPFTFGHLGRIAKVTPMTIALWSRVLAAIPHARLLLKDRPLDDPAIRQRLTEEFQAAGIACDRLIFEGGSSRHDHLAAYNRVDVALDPLPHGGGITTFEALWMGVPVITQELRALPGRLCAGIQTALGLRHMVTADADAYVALAEACAAAPERLAQLRPQLRPRLAESPLGHPRAYAQAVEDAYRGLWRSYCETGQATPQRPLAPASDQPFPLPPPQSDFAEAHGLYATALELDERGAYANALRYLRAALAGQPDYPEAMHQLAQVQDKLGQERRAEISYRALAAIFPAYARGLCALGSFLQSRGRIDEAEETYLKALAADADLAEAMCNLAAIKMRAGAEDEAETLLNKAVQLDSSLTEAHLNLGLLRRKQGRLELAEEHLRKALRFDPDNPNSVRALAELLESQGQHGEALSLRERAAAQPSASAWTLIACAVALRRKGGFREGLNLTLRARAKAPTMPEAHYNLGYAYAMLGRTDLAIESYEKALELAPDSPNLLANLGLTYSVAGKMDKARELLERCIQLYPDKAGPYVNRIFLSDYDAELTTEQQQDLRRDYFKRFGQPKQDVRHDLVRDPERRLRIGYLSGDFFRHSASQAFGMVVLNHNLGQFEPVCYSTTEIEDDITDEFRGKVELWREVRHLDDTELEAMIRADGIDILVDLSAFSSRSRINVLPSKPAPVQVTAWGHANGTGCAQVDVLFSDPVVIPYEERQYYSERIIDLPCFICLRPPPSPPVAPRPALTNGFITFGSMNRISKVSDEALRLWGRILKQVPNSRLLIKDKELDSVQLQDDTRARALRAGIDVDRLDLLGWTTHYGQLATFARIDICLDPFPYGGGISTLEALWMGVPVIAKRGRNHVGRLGAAVITSAGLSWCVAEDDAHYADLAVSLAQNEAQLNHLRENLRTSMANSPITRPDLYVPHVEAAYRQLWREWCAKPE